MDDHVHVGHGPGVGGVFLAEELQRRILLLPVLLPGRLHLLFHGDFALDQQAAGTAAGVIDLHAGLGVHHPRHDHADFRRGVKLAGALAAALGELADEVFIALADDVRLDILQPEALGADGLDEVGEAVVVDVALAVGGGVEVDAIDDALEQRVFLRDLAHVGGELLADLVRELADDGPDRCFRVIRHQWQVEAHQLVVGLDELEGLLARADFRGDAVQLVIEDVAEALGEDERQDEVLVFGCILGPANGAGGVPDPGFEGFVFGCCGGDRLFVYRHVVILSIYKCPCSRRVSCLPTSGIEVFSLQ